MGYFDSSAYKNGPGYMVQITLKSPVELKIREQVTGELRIYLYTKQKLNVRLDSLLWIEYFLL